MLSGAGLAALALQAGLVASTRRQFVKALERQLQFEKTYK